MISSQKFCTTLIGSSEISAVIIGQWGHLGLLSLVPFPLIYPISLFPALWLVLTIEFFETAASPNNAYSGPGAFETLNLQVDIVSEDEKIFDFMFWGRRRGKNVRIIPYYDMVRTTTISYDLLYEQGVKCSQGRTNRKKIWRNIIIENSLHLFTRGLVTHLTHHHA